MQKPATDRVHKKKVCDFCKPKAKPISYMDVPTLRRYISDRGKIRSPRLTGACKRHQRHLAVAIKNAREMALLPFALTLPAGKSHRAPGSR